jgi:putative DNA primase/helicase
VATSNGLLDIEHKRLYPHSPMYFNLVAVPFDFDANAEAPKRWLAFLEELWPDDPAAIDALGEWSGYVISGRLDLHKILLMVGPTRAGKGVIARVLSALVGDRNVAGPTLSSLGGEFGLAPLLGKTLAVISDARFVGKNGQVVVERLLSISGEDSLTVNRKYRDQWTGKLPCRLHIVSNELPRLGDASAAIVGRIVLLMLSRSWLGREDYGLEVALRGELPGILNWALDGLHRLTVENENTFTRTAGADEAVAQMRDLASPVGAYVRERCEVGKVEFEITVEALYTDFKIWADSTNNSKSTKQTFGRDLHAAFPGIRLKRPRVGASEEEKRVRIYTGIKLREK